jgi:hypothetical protein
MADIIPHNVIALMANGSINFTGDTLKVALIDDTYTPNADNTNFTTGSDPFDSELATGYGYTAGGVTVSGSITDQDASDNVKFDITDPEWTATSGTIGPARYGVLWDDTATNDPIIYIFDFAANQSAGAGTQFKITISASGLFTGAQA